MDAILAQLRIKSNPIKKTDFQITFQKPEQPQSQSQLQQLQSQSQSQSQSHSQSQSQLQHQPSQSRPVVLNTTIVDRRDTAVIDRNKIEERMRQLENQAYVNIETQREVSELEKPLEKPLVTGKPKKLRKLKLGDKPERPERPEAPAQPEEPERPEPTEEPERPEEPEPTEEPERPEEPEPTERPEPTEEPKPIEEPEPTEEPAQPVQLDNTALVSSFRNKLPLREKHMLFKAQYYMNNRKFFIKFINALFYPYKKAIAENVESLTCNLQLGETGFSLLTHQKIVRDYINLYSPYRGLLLYHGLGSGKTCSSIGIAEGMKSDSQIIIMTPASLRNNYIQELKNCGDKLYKKNQYWEFIPIAKIIDIIDLLSEWLSLSSAFIVKNKGVWFVDKNKLSNYTVLTSAEQISLDAQLNIMIEFKYAFINYNGMRKKDLDAISLNGTINPFSNKVIIIDEAHNFVSRIVNKIDKKVDQAKGDFLSIKLYKYLMTAENCKIILLTGTPIINYPNEFAISMNILRGVIKTWTLKLETSNPEKITEDYFVKLFRSHPDSKATFDYLQYKPKETTLTITRNPYGYKSYIDSSNRYQGVKRDVDVFGNVTMDGNVTDLEFMSNIKAILQANNIEITNPPPPGPYTKLTEPALNTCLPDKKEDFIDKFIEIDKLKNMNLFKRRILGLVSYFPDIDALLPEYNRATDLIIFKIPMSDFQMGAYEVVRSEERKLEKNNALRMRMKKADEESSSTYRIFSRSYCNFVFPPDIIRPLPKGNTISEAIVDAENNDDEDVLDGVSVEEKIKDIQEGNSTEDIEDADEKLKDVDAVMATKSYDDRISEALTLLNARKAEYLSPKALETYSPKFLNILNNVLDVDLKGLHLIYSMFRTLEGIAILSLILEANGFAQFKIKQVSKNSKEWKLNMAAADRAKPKFVLYTGTETVAEKELIRNIFNGNWDVIPSNLQTELMKIHPNNLNGEIIKIIMITASGAEGISLKNVRFVHITEPYWHPVRMTQVIGRARRICSHADLPKELRTVKVFLYLMTFTEAQIKDENYKELRLQDVGKKEDTSLRPLTSDEALYEISTIKEDINKEILKNIKEASIDCNIHKTVGGKEELMCFSFGNVNSDTFSYTPSINKDDEDKDVPIHVVERKMKATRLGKDFAYDKVSGAVYSYESYKNARNVDDLIQTGTGEIDENGNFHYKAFIKPSEYEV